MNRVGRSAPLLPLRRTIVGSRELMHLLNEALKKATDCAGNLSHAVTAIKVASWFRRGYARRHGTTDPH